MVIDSYYTRVFESDKISCTKYNEIESFAYKLLEIKNKVAVLISKKPRHFLNLSRFDFEKELRYLIIDAGIPSNFYRALFIDLYEFYQTKAGKTFKKLNFRLKTGKKYRYTPLTQTVSWLARYGNKNSYQEIKKNLENKDLKDNQRKFYESILFYCDKFTFKRLYRLAKSRRNRVFRNFKDKPVVFKSLTFRGRTRVNEAFNQNKNEDSIITTFFNMSWLKKGKQLSIPVKYNKKWFGNLSQYNKANNTEYTIRSCSNKREIKIHVAIPCKRGIPTNKKNFIGFDVNVSNNMLTASTGKTFDYNRDLLKDLYNEKLKTDKLISENQEYKIGKRRKKKLDTIERKVKDNETRIIVDAIKYSISKGRDHIVLENLEKTFSKTKWKTKDGLNLNRVNSLLHICSIKNWFERIARKYDVQVSFVPSYYTSRYCPKCGCIHKDNRKTQEKFKCVSCGYERNADVNAANNIRRIMVSTVLRNQLMKELDNGLFEPKVLSKDDAFKILFLYGQERLVKSTA